MGITKGEWLYDGARIRTNTTVIASPWCDSNYDHQLPESNRFHEIQANGHLIAAAPDMYEACKIALEDADAKVQHVSTKTFLIRALAKAEGK